MELIIPFEQTDRGGVMISINAVTLA